MQTLASIAALARVLAPPVLSLLNNFSSCTKNASKAADLSKAGLLLFCFAVIRTISPSISTHIFAEVTAHCIWNIPPRFCIIELWSIARRCTVLAPTRCCWPVSASQSGQTAADLCSGCGIVSLDGTTAATAAPARGWSCSPKPALCWPPRCRTGHRAHHAVCADLRAFREGEGSYDLCACNPARFHGGEQAKTQPGPQPATRRTARWTMSANARSAC